MPLLQNTLQAKPTRAKALKVKLAHALLICSLVATVSPTAFAVPTTSNSASTNTAATSSATDNAETPADPQVAPMPDSPFNENSNPLNKPDSLAKQMQPSDNELSNANQQLLSRNAKLQRQVNDLETRVNVLTNEHSGQLFMYGAFTVVISVFVGFGLGGLIFGRRDRW